MSAIWWWIKTLLLPALFTSNNWTVVYIRLHTSSSQSFWRTICGMTHLPTAPTKDSHPFAYGNSTGMPNIWTTYLVWLIVDYMPTTYHHYILLSSPIDLPCRIAPWVPHHKFPVVSLVSTHLHIWKSWHITQRLGPHEIVRGSIHKVGLRRAQFWPRESRRPWQNKLHEFLETIWARNWCLLAYNC